MDKKEDTALKKIITEMPSRYENLDEMPVRDLIEGINMEDSCVHEAVKKALPAIEKLIDLVLPKMRKGGRIFYIGAGTSGRLGVLDASELPPTFGVPGTMVTGIIAGGDTALRRSVEKAEDDTGRAWYELQQFNINTLDTVIGIAASGTTPYVVGGLEDASKNGILTGCITCNPGSPVSRAAKMAIEVVVGPEFLTGSTRMKAGTAQKMVLNMISTTIMIKLGKVKGNKMVNMQLTNNKLVRRGIVMLMEELKMNADDARQLLFKYGSVRQAIESMNRKR